MSEFITHSRDERAGCKMLCQPLAQRQDRKSVV